MDEIKAQIKEFEEFKNNLERQQLRFPIDSDSKKILYEDVLVPEPDFTLIPFGLGTYDKATQIVLNGKRYWLTTTDFNNY